MSFMPATKQVGYVKGSMYGPPGSGKTTLAAMLAIYLAKTYHHSAPVAWLASEKGVDFVLDFFKEEGVPLLINRSRSYLDLKNAHKEALSAKCCALVIDSTSHFWKELYTTGMQRGGRKMDRIQRIKEEWEPFAQEFQDLPIHSLATGRLGYKWDDAEVENERGEIVKELTKEGTKMKAEGDFGHEPDLELEMSSVEDPEHMRWEKVRGKARKTFCSSMLHVATVKKARVWALNGKAFSWKDQPKYKLGYYKSVAECFKAHFDTIAIGGTHHVVDAERPNSDSLFLNGNDHSYHEQQIKRDILIEKWEGAMTEIAPGQTGVAQKTRAVIGKTISGTTSKTEFQRQPLEVIAKQLAVLVALGARLKLDTPSNDEELTACIQMATEDVEHPGKDRTLLEVMGQRSLETVTTPKGETVEVPF